MPMARERTLPPLGELAEDIARRLGGVARILADGGHDAAAAIAFDGAHLLLVRDHRWTLSVSLPHERSWSVQTADQWDAVEPEVRHALASCARIVTLSDVILALRPSFPHLAPSFPGTPVPSEAWMRDAATSIGLFQGEKGVRVSVWIESEAVERTVDDRSAIAALAAWLGPQIEKQHVARAAAEAESKRRAALPVPALDTVLARLRSGARISTGGGRWFETYFIEEGRLRREIFDEGLSDVGDATENELAKSISAHPDRFRE
jgi:hypothetical protein